DNFKYLLEDLDKLDYTKVIELERKISLIKTPEVENIKTYGMRRIRRHINNISEVFFDWAITKEVEKSK
ncbi:MAG: hypothetical protein U9O94_09165, partial [Nanoarchaeota archaeon]|nr:hypothetical protein [Nanoarchaeota archaeon]